MTIELRGFTEPEITDALCRFSLFILNFVECDCGSYEDLCVVCHAERIYEAFSEEEDAERK